jgi:hypothetical protein
VLIASRAKESKTNPASLLLPVEHVEDRRKSGRCSEAVLSGLSCNDFVAEKTGSGVLRDGGLEDWPGKRGLVRKQSKKKKRTTAHLIEASSVMRNPEQSYLSIISYSVIHSFSLDGRRCLFKLTRKRPISVDDSEISHSRWPLPISKRSPKTLEANPSESTSTETRLPSEQTRMKVDSAEEESELSSGRGVLTARERLLRWSERLSEVDIALLRYLGAGMEKP